MPTPVINLIPAMITFGCVMAAAGLIFTLGPATRRIGAHALATGITVATAGALVAWATATPLTY